MVFSSPFFLFVFLPVVLLLIFLFPKKLHNIILLVASMFFYAWGSVSQSILFIISILINYAFGIWISNAEGKRAKLILTISATINLLLLGYFKYFNFFVENINFLISGQAAEPITVSKVALPIGISFFTFHALSYIIDVYRKKVPVQRNFLDLALYISFFPQLIAGPIVRYIDVADQFKSRILSLEKASAGIQRFIFGFAKKVIVANSMAYLADQIFDVPTDQISSGAAWLGAIAYTLQIYFDFSGYSDMAIGLAKIFGFNFPENFNYPYSAQSIKEFWRRWHISLSTWFRDFLYIPLGGSKGSEGRTLLNLLIVFFCTGFWHGASWSFIVWGMFHGTFLLIERIGFDKILVRTWKPVQVCYTLLVVMVGWVFFRADTLAYGLSFLHKMSFLSFSGQEQLFAADYLDNKIIFLLIFSVLYSFRVFRFAQEKCEQYFITKQWADAYHSFFQTIKLVIAMALFFLSVLSLAAGTYNPFIYFRF